MLDREHVLRALFERLSRRVVLERRLPADLGGYAILVSPDASLRFWFRDLAAVDSVLLAAARELVRPGDVVWDVGANVGLFSFAAAGRSRPDGRVLAIEPDPWLAQLVNRSATLNPDLLGRFNVLQAALTERAGDAVLHVARRGRAANYVAGFMPSTQTGGVREALAVRAVTLDALLDDWPRPDVLKIDVEGAEASVLRGARRVLHEVRPRILCEVSQANRYEVSAAFDRAAYAMYDVAQPAGRRERIECCAWNTIALPGRDGARRERAGVVVTDRCPNPACGTTDVFAVLERSCSVRLGGRIETVDFRLACCRVCGLGYVDPPSAPHVLDAFDPSDYAYWDAPRERLSHATRIKYELARGRHLQQLRRGFSARLGSRIARLTDRDFDRLRLEHVLEHQPAPIETLAALRGKLRPGAHMVLTVP
ncbi:MAG TPA: FkbM family methyltransferase, partial [Candidatus Polarisedimenticolaceae bacterium]|nr:FkbM family methyltransferase [Candidatus Polarisedimenticolaceae bacterium]